MKDKRIGLITVCGDPNPRTADPIAHSFKSTAEMTKPNWIGVVMASASDKGEIIKDENARKQAFELGKKQPNRNNLLLEHTKKVLDPLSFENKAVSKGIFLRNQCLAETGKDFFVNAPRPSFYPRQFLLSAAL